MKISGHFLFSERPTFHTPHTSHFYSEERQGRIFFVIVAGLAIYFWCLCGGDQKTPIKIE
jgi:hypothetical protein